MHRRPATALCAPKAMRAQVQAPRADKEPESGACGDRLHGLGAIASGGKAAGAVASRPVRVGRRAAPWGLPRGQGAAGRGL